MTGSPAFVVAFAVLGSAAFAGETDPFTDAWRALERGRTSEATTLMQSAHAADPTRQPAARCVALLDRLDLPCPDPDLDTIRRMLPTTFREARSTHFVLLHDHGDAEARERLELAERVLTTFLLWFGGRGIDLDVPKQRLVTAWYPRRADYIAYVKAVGGPGLAATHGYYHPTTGLVAAFDERDAEGGRTKIAMTPAHKSLDIATLAHETAHQLTAHCGLAPDDASFPTWLQEGIAMQFEASVSGDWAGVGRPNPHRLNLARGLRPRLTLARVVGDDAFESGTDIRRYASAWSLIYWLQNRHPREFVAFLDQLRFPASEDRSSKERVLSAFRATIGADFVALDQEWRREVEAIRLP